MEQNLELKKWGNSQGVRIPKKIRDAVKLKLNRPIRVSVVDGAVVLRPLPQPPSLSSLLEGVTPKDVAGEYGWGEVGAEAYE